MLRYVGIRLIQLIPILFGVTFLSFAVMHLAAGDVVDAMSQNTGEVLTEELEHRIKRMGTLLEPALILLVGLLVAVILISMYMPMFRLGGIMG